MECEISKKIRKELDKASELKENETGDAILDFDEVMEIVDSNINEYSKKILEAVEQLENILKIGERSND